MHKIDPKAAERTISRGVAEMSQICHGATNAKQAGWDVRHVAIEAMGRLCPP
jgi:hypothetical protein